MINSKFLKNLRFRVKANYGLNSKKIYKNIWKKQY